MSAGAPRGLRAPRRRRQRGLASVEFALCLQLIFIVLLPPALLLSRTFMYYTVLSNAAHGAAQFMATVPASEMGAMASRIAAMGQARALVVDAARGARLGVAVAPTSIAVLCNGLPCDTSIDAPGNIQVLFSVTPPNDLLNQFLYDFRNGAGFKLTLDSTVPYAN